MNPNPFLQKLGYSETDRLVIIHTDDIGMCHASVQAFYDLWAFGTVTSGATMVPCPWFPAVAQMCRANPAIDMGVHATLKHFLGYSASRAGRNHAPVHAGPREIADVFLPPFEMAVREAGAGSVMNSYSDVDGVPAGADPWLLTEILRDAWGFEGTVVSDYWAVPFLASMHRVAADTDAAGALALTAGIDVELPDTLGFGQRLAQWVADGELDVGFINHYYVAQAQAEEGSDYPVEVFFPPGGDPGSLVNVAGIGILDSSGSKDEAERFTRFMLSPEAQQYFARETKEYPVASGVRADRRLVPLEDIQQPDIDLSNLDDLQGTLRMIEEAGAL